MTYFDEAFERLARVDERIAQDALTPPPVHRTERRRRFLALGGLTAAVASLAVAVGIPSLGSDGPSGRGTLAVLQTPKADAADVAKVIDPQAAGILDITNAHPFKTPNGNGYLIPRRDGRQLCIAIPDRPDGYGLTCQGRRMVERRGMPIRLTSPGLPTSGPSITAVVLPAGVTEATIRTASGERTLDAPNGVAVVTVKEDGSLSWDTARGEESVALDAVFGG